MVRRTEIFPGTLIAEHAARIGGYADSFVALVPGNIPLAQYVEAFYTSRVFRAERFLLGLTGLPSTDDQARAVATGTGTRIALWTHPLRRENELLMQEASGRTASWFMVRPGAEGTELFFGTTVTPARPGSGRIPFAYRVLGGVHLAYSRLLLASAVRALGT